MNNYRIIVNAYGEDPKKAKKGKKEDQNAILDELLVADKLGLLKDKVKLALIGKLKMRKKEKKKEQELLNEGMGL